MSRFPNPFEGTASLPIPMVPLRDDSVWEYRRIERNVRTESAPSEDELNALGQNGWEVAGMYFDSPMLYLYLKRLS